LALLTRKRRKLVAARLRKIPWLPRPVPSMVMLDVILKAEGPTLVSPTPVRMMLVFVAAPPNMMVLAPIVLAVTSPNPAADWAFAALIASRKVTKPSPAVVLSKGLVTTMTAGANRSSSISTLSVRRRDEPADFRERPEAAKHASNRQRKNPNMGA